MYRTLSISRKSPLSHPNDENRTEELAQMLVHAFGYDAAMEQASRSRWDDVADTIRFLAGQSFRRF